MIVKDAHEVIARLKRETPAERARRNKQLCVVLQSWLEEDEGDQKESWKALKRALGKDRPATRKLFG